MSNLEEITFKSEYNFLRALFSRETLICLLIFITIGAFIMTMFFNENIIGVSPSHYSQSLFNTLTTCSVAAIIFVQVLYFMRSNLYKYGIDKEKITKNLEGFNVIGSYAITIKDIQEIHKTQTFVQRIFGLENIYVLTKSGTSYNNLKRGILIHNVRTSLNIYKLLNNYLNLALNGEEELDNSKVQLLKPQHAFIYGLFPAIFVSVLITGYFAFILTSIYGLLQYNIDYNRVIEVCIIPAFVCLFIIIIPTILYFKDEYIVGSNKIESISGYFSRHHASIHRKNIASISSEQNLLQKYFGIQNIVISTLVQNFEPDANRLSAREAFKNEYTNNINSTDAPTEAFSFIGGIKMKHIDKSFYIER